METFGEQLPSINQLLNQIPTGSGFQTTPSWEGPDQWSNQGLYLLILSFRLKHNRGNFEGDANSHFCDSFQQLNGQSMLPVMPMTSVTTPATINRDSQVSAIPDPITGATSPTSDRGPTPSPQMTTPRCSTRSTKGVPPVHYTPSRKWQMMC